MNKTIEDAFTMHINVSVSDLDYWNGTVLSLYIPGLYYSMFVIYFFLSFIDKVTR